MNVFHLDNDPQKCAEYHNDKHCVKMILEYAQLLCSAHHVLDCSDNQDLYKLTHKNHPCSIWVRKNSANYNWLYSLFCSLLQEYSHRYGRVHKTSRLCDILARPPKNITHSVHCSPFAQAMPDKYKNITDSVSAYRILYQTEKAHIAQWSNRNKPFWVTLL